MRARSSGSVAALVIVLAGLGLLLRFAVLSQPRFSGIQLLTNREIALTVSGSNGIIYRIDAATNVTVWSPLVTLTGAAPVFQHTDSAAPYLTQRFYRSAQLGVTNFTGDHLPTTNGDVIIHPINHATFVMSWNGKMIYNDPVGGSTPFTGFPRANLILVSHSHGDHFSSTTLNSVTGLNCVIIAPQAVYNSMGTALRALTTVLTNGAATNVMGMNIEAVPAYNIINTTYHPRGTGNGYVLTLGGRRLYMAGDTEDVPEMRALPNIDVAFVCMNIPFTMPVSNAVSAVRAFRPRVVYPYHFRNQDGTYADLNDFKRRVGQDLGIEVRNRRWY